MTAMCLRVLHDAIVSQVEYNFRQVYHGKENGQLLFFTQFGNVIIFLMLTVSVVKVESRRDPDAITHISNVQIVTHTL